MRLGFECGEKALATQSRSILVVDPIEMSDATISCASSMRLLIGPVGSFTRKSADNPPKKALEAIPKEAFPFFVDKREF
ncbi:hypothetical protein [Candidatus Methylacidithermus pantelleriae]|nr:hypothetical protein [Candidatus Methylacidithermus pantelleriae]